MENKCVIFDFDGVVSHFTNGKFSERLKREHPEDAKILEYFEESHGKCVAGKAKTSELLPKYIEGTKWSFNSLVKYWVEGDTNTDPEMISLISSLRQNGIKRTQRSA